MTRIKAIETRYAGHRFRSRLEARWAVFFDALGVRWQYEPEGIVCSYRLSCQGGGDLDFPYLPDFYLPDFDLWAEVKGRFAEEADFVRLLDAAAHLSCTDDGDMLLLGPIANPMNTPFRLSFYKGYLGAGAWGGETQRRYDCDTYSQLSIDVAGDWGGGGWEGVRVGEPFVGRALPADWRLASEFLLAGAEPDVRTLPAMRAAACARFEHGETPHAP